MSPTPAPAPGGLAGTVALYALARIALLAAVAGLLVVVGVPLAIALLVGIVVALPLSMVLFRGLRGRLDAALAASRERRARERAALRARLRGDHDAAPEAVPGDGEHPPRPAPSRGAGPDPVPSSGGAPDPASSGRAAPDPVSSGGDAPGATSSTRAVAPSSRAVSDPPSAEQARAGRPVPE
jgi:hypothetical protein